MTTAFKSLKVVSKTMEGFVPALDATSESINNTLAETMAQMGQISPGITVDIHNENAEELVEQARRFAEEQAEKLKQSLHVMPSRFEADVNMVEDSDPDTRDGGRLRGGEPDTRHHILEQGRPQGRERGAPVRHGPQRGHRRLGDLALSSGIPQDEVEQSMIRLVAQGKVKSPRSESSR